MFRFIMIGRIGLFALFLSLLPCYAQDIEPRRWSHLPLGGNFGGVAYAFTQGDIFLNPVLRIEDGEFDMHTAAFKYIHAFEILDKSARIDLTQSYQSGSWSGLLNGIPASTERDGWTDTTLRLAVNLYGAPPLAGQEFIDYRKATDSETIVGVGLVMAFPTGEYFEDRLINLGSNRYSFSPQFGFVHTQGHWTFEFSSSVTLYTDNNDFFNNVKHEEDPLINGQGHLIYTFMPGFWVGASAGYGYGGESTINHVSSNDQNGNLGFGLSSGVSFTRNFGVKIAYIGVRTQEDTGSDNDTFTIAFSLQW